MDNIKVTIPRLTFVKLFLRGIHDFSFMREIKKRASRTEEGKRVGLKTSRGVVTYFEKISKDEVVVLTAYHLGEEKEPIGKRAVALMGILVEKMK